MLPRRCNKKGRGAKISDLIPPHSSPHLSPPPHLSPGAQAEQEAGRRAQETLEIITEISQLLNTGLDRESVSILTSLCEMGVNPEALAAVVKELRRESAAIVGFCRTCVCAAVVRVLCYVRGARGVVQALRS